MASNDIGIDLGTASVIIYDSEAGLLLREPSVVAVDAKTGELIAAGFDAQRMLGRTPGHIEAKMPLSDGVISDYALTQQMIAHFIKKVYAGSLIKPRVVICVPSGVTGVEADAVLSAAASAGARKVYLIEEPVAAALGAGIRIHRPEGNCIVDIGGGTADIAVLSLNGVVCKDSVRIAGRHFDRAIVKYVRQQHKLLLGERMAEEAKIHIGSVCFTPEESCEFLVKGRSLTTGMPGKLTLTREELSPVLLETAQPIVTAVRQLLAITPPELAADIYTNGLVLTGGGALLHGLDRLLSQEMKLSVRLADAPTECVAKGTALAFQSINSLADGFEKGSSYLRSQS